MLVATGSNRNTLTNREGGTDPEQFRDEQVLRDSIGAMSPGGAAVAVNCDDPFLSVRSARSLDLENISLPLRQIRGKALRNADMELARLSRDSIVWPPSSKVTRTPDRD